MPQEALLTILIKAVVLVFVVLTAFAYLTLLERKLIGRMQARYGPNRAGPLGSVTSPVLVPLIIAACLVPAMVTVSSCVVPSAVVSVTLSV